MNISYKEHTTNEKLCRRIQAAIGKYDGPLVKKENWVDLPKTSRQLTVKGKEEKIDRRRGEKTISKNGQEWTFPVQLGHLKVGPGGEGLLRSPL